MDGQIQMVNGIVVCARVAVRYVFQPQLVACCFGNFLAPFKPEGFRIFQELPHLRNIQALLVQLDAVLQNTHHPGGKGGHCGEIQKELRNGQILFQRHVQQVYIGDAVSCHGKHSLGNIRQQKLALHLI